MWQVVTGSHMCKYERRYVFYDVLMCMHNVQHSMHRVCGMRHAA